MHVARLEISGVRGFYGARSVALDFVRPDGTFAGWTVLAGRNGSGKSTLLQALALVLSGPRATAFIPSLADWMSNGVTTADMTATLHRSREDRGFVQPSLFSEDPQVSMHFARPPQPPGWSEDPPEPEFRGSGLDSLTSPDKISSVTPKPSGWFYAGYGPFRHLGRGVSGGAWKSRRSNLSKLSLQVSSLFDESISLVDAVDWLVEQHLYDLEDRPGAGEFLRTMMALLGDGLLPDGFQISRVNSDGLWVSRGDTEFPLREMSDGYRAVTALVVDIVRQMSGSYSILNLEYQGSVPTLPYPGVVLIDEVDAHLHVSWQKVIGAWLKEHFPGIQFIVTTHSPYICQSADPGGLILLPGPGDPHPPHTIDQDLYERVIYGSGDDAILTDLFGVETPYSVKSEMLRQRLGELEIKVLDGAASDAEREEYRSLSSSLNSSLSARVDEIAARLGREQ